MTTECLPTELTTLAVSLLQVDLVTETDKRCEKEVFDALRSAFPDHAFIGAGMNWSSGV